MSDRQNKNLIHSPVLNITLGERCRMKDGSPGIRLKRNDKYETFAAIKYIELVFGKEVWSFLINRLVGSPSETTTEEII